MSNKVDKRKYLQYLPDIYLSRPGPSIYESFNKQFLPEIYRSEEEKKNLVFLENFLKPFEKILSGIKDEYLFCWDEIPGIDNGRLREFLNQKYVLDWIKNAEIEKIKDGRTIKVSAGKNHLSLKLNDERTKVYLEIDKSRKDEFTAKTEKDKLNIYRADEIKGIEEILDNIQDFFDPSSTPLEFLPWLAGWMALTLKEDEEWNVNESRKKRDLIARIIPLYRMRGTLEGLEKYIRIYVGEDVRISIHEFLEPFCVGVTSTVGMNTVVGEGKPYYFQVYMELPMPNRVLLEKKKRAIIDIIDLEKPAHTYYLLLIRVPTMQIGYYDPMTREREGHSTIGVDTMLGGILIGKNSM